MAQLIAWVGDAPVGGGMVLFPNHEEYSVSAVREGCAEVRDVFVVPDRRRAGVARTLMDALEETAREAGFERVGLSVSITGDAEPARRLYRALGYRHAHGPFVWSSNLRGDDGPIPVGGSLTYLVREL